MGNRSNCHQQRVDLDGSVEMSSLCFRAMSGRANWAGYFLQKQGLSFSAIDRRFALQTPPSFFGIASPHHLTVSFPWPQTWLSKSSPPLTA